VIDLEDQSDAVAQALAPLHAGYLRRLGEMAARVPPAALLREATTRDGAGLLVLGADGFPLRFDVADAVSGETFEVRSGTLDSPSASRLVVGRLTVELLPGAWEALRVVCRFDGVPLEEDARALAGLFHAFAALGVHGGYSAREAAAPWSGRVHGLQLEIEGEEVTAVIDLGTCPPQALAQLVRALDRFGQERAPLARVSLGGRVD
jgi:hypothetical protein